MRWRNNQYKTQKQHKSDYSTAEKQDQDVLTGNIGYDLEHVKRKKDITGTFISVSLKSLNYM